MMMMMMMMMMGGILVEYFSNSLYIYTMVIKVNRNFRIALYNNHVFIFFK